MFVSEKINTCEKDKGELVRKNETASMIPENINSVERAMTLIKAFFEIIIQVRV